MKSSIIWSLVHLIDLTPSTILTFLFSMIWQAGMSSEADIILQADARTSLTRPFFWFAFDMNPKADIISEANISPQADMSSEANMIRQACENPIGKRQYAGCT